MWIYKTVISKKGDSNDNKYIISAIKGKFSTIQVEELKKQYQEAATKKRIYGIPMLRLSKRQTKLEDKDKNLKELLLNFYDADITKVFVKQ